MHYLFASADANMWLRLHLRTALIVAVALVLTEDVGASKKSVKVRLSAVTASIARRWEQQKARQAIVRCCGKRRCTSNSQRTRTNSTTITASYVNTTVAASKNTDAATTNVDNAPATAAAETAAEQTGTTDPQTTVAAEEALMVTAEVQRSTVALPQSQKQGNGVSFASGGSSGSSGSSTSRASSTFRASSTSIGPNGSSSSNGSGGSGGANDYNKSSPVCKAPSCETFKKGLERDAAAVVPKGASVFHLDRFYFFTSTAASLMSAAKVCFNLNMTILSINNLATIGSYLSLLQESAQASVWTSGSAEGESCDSERKFTWCAIGAVLNESDVKNPAYWTKEPETKPTSDKCLTLNYAATSVGLLAADCTATKPLLCQPTCNSGSCMQNITCIRNESLFVNGTLKNAMHYGIWAETCGSKYLFGKKVVNWTQNVERCCALGMQPIIFTTADQQTCLSNLTSTNWTGNWNYWTGGFQSCKGMWGWCDGVAEFRPMPKGLRWAQNRPDLTKGANNCTQMRISRNGSGVALNDRECKERYVYACQAKESDLQPKDAPKPCIKDNSLFETVKGKVQVTKPFALGDWYTTCGQKLFFPFKKMTWNDAWNYCCSLDMKLISVASAQKHSCLSKFSKRYPVVANADLWTSAAKGVSALRWFARNEVLVNEDTNWENGGKADGECVHMRFSNVSANLTTFALADCTQNNSFVCEVVNNIQHSDADVKQMECMDIFNISYEEFDILRSGTFNARTLSFKLKCFIKCIGDLTGLFLSGQFTLTMDALRVIEELSATPDDLQTNMGIVDQCGNPASLDECERAAEVYQCGMEKAPAVVNAIQSTLTVDVPLGPSMHPYVPNDARFCRTKDLPCVVDVDRQRQWLTTRATAEGKQMVTASGKIYFVAPDSFENRTHRYAHNYCCSLGMKIVEFLNKAEAEALTSNLAEAIIILGDVYVTGQLQDVYCHSGFAITDTTLYKFGRPNDYQSITGKSCYHMVKFSAAIDTFYESACDLDEPPMIPAYLVCEDTPEFDNGP